MDWAKYHCERKKRYARESAAQRVVDRMRKTKPQTARLVAYPCEVCGGFHVGNKPRGMQ